MGATRLQGVVSLINVCSGSSEFLLVMWQGALDYRVSEDVALVVSSKLGLLCCVLSNGVSDDTIRLM